MFKLKNRQEAGRKLAVKLEKYRNAKQPPLILGMPRGGVVLAYEIAQVLQAPLDVIVARKIGAPGEPEFAIGAIAPGDVIVWNEALRSYFGNDETMLASLVTQEQQEMQRRLDLYRGKNAADLHDAIEGKTVIIVDDGIATGQSALAAIKAVRKMQPAKIILAVGVAAVDSISMLRSLTDEVICLATPEPFQAVGLWYEEFEQVEDDEVIKLITRNRQELAAVEK